MGHFLLRPGNRWPGDNPMLGQLDATQQGSGEKQ
jgi:hypothetical protein